MDIWHVFGLTDVFKTMTPRFRWRISKTACVVLVLVVLMVSVYQRSEFRTGHEFPIARIVRMQRFYWRDLQVKSTAPATEAVARRKQAVPWDVTSANCSANDSVSSEEWFEALQPNFKQFLLYRHCRHFPMILNHPEKCSGDVHLLMVVKSIITQYDRREVIRQTWGKEQEVDGKKIKIVFLLAASSNEAEKDNHQKLLEYEDYKYGDILQWDFMDSFFNLTLKETHFLKWFSVYCGNVSYVYKGDDDVFVNVKNILEYLDSSKDKRDLFAGDVIFKAQPIRREQNKYYVPQVLYNETYYPPYAGGGGFLMDGPLTRKLYTTSQALELYPIDDVFLGMCLQVLQVKPIKHGAFKTFGLVKNKTSQMNKEPCFYQSMIVVHKLLPKELTDMWKLVNTKLVCTHKVTSLTETGETLPMS